MDKFKTKIIILVACGISLVTIGVCVWILLNDGKHSSIQGYMFNNSKDATDSDVYYDASDADASDANANYYDASDANASDANAYYSNASDANAYYSNASDANASDADVQIEPPIVVNANSNTIIDEELFETIEGEYRDLVINYRDNQIIFNGLDIVEPKSFDVSMSIDKVSNYKDINKIVPNGYVFKLLDNGELPGEAYVRIKSTNAMDKDLNDLVYLYEYDRSSNTLQLAGYQVGREYGYYAFTIYNNSEYVIVNEELDSKIINGKKDEKVVSFQKGNGTLLILIGLGAVAIIAAVVVIVVLKMKKKNSSDENKDI